MTQELRKERRLKRSKYKGIKDIILSITPMQSDFFTGIINGFQCKCPRFCY